ncbi:MAG: imidazole glycerol phosphate synthase subunit HisH [Myxococcales bacterium]|nr:imidazole glycerol phosphate synthase subunit HisH [Myxococcales bacterium]
MRRVVILDVCSGNVRSVQRALQAASETATANDRAAPAHEIILTSDVAAIATAEALVVPGQGAFGTFRAAMERGGYEAPLRAYLASGKPYLGICLGMQVLFERSEEQGEHQGLGVVAGAVRRFATVGASGAPRKVPHMGWNQVTWHAGNEATPHPLRMGLANGQHFYFVHSYYADAGESDAARATLATTDYDGRFCAAVVRGNIAGVQFHPEKSHDAGLKFLTNFLRWQP